MLANSRYQIRLHSLFLSFAAGALLTACSSEITGVTTDAGDPHLGTAVGMLVDGNGMSQNGMSQNGMSQNGMSQNGMSQNGFGTAAFKSWFNANPALSDMVMKYVAKCAAAAGQSYSWKNPTTGVTHTWSGQLGLAPGFAAGSPPTIAEQQVITACLALHVNPYGLSVPISVLGRSAAGATIPYTQAELTAYSVPEACWFGNLFASEGVYLAFDTGSQGPQQSATRACSFNGPSRQDCSPLVVTGKSCWDICSRGGESNFWVSCTWNGKVYPALTTRYRHQEVVTCGDGVCQVSEHCGTGTTANSCSSDCGVCR